MKAFFVAMANDTKSKAAWNQLPSAALMQRHESASIAVTAASASLMITLLVICFSSLYVTVLTITDRGVNKLFTNKSKKSKKNEKSLGGWFPPSLKQLLPFLLLGHQMRP